MRPAALILLVIWATAMCQPAFALVGGRPAYELCKKVVVTNLHCSAAKSSSPACSKKKAAKTDCSKKSSSKPSKSGDNNCCKNEGCNPTLGCSSGNFYVHQYYQISFPSWDALKLLRGVKDDNRIAKALSECWQPPEA